MEVPKLENLLLTDEERVIAREQVELAAYFKWKDAGCPGGHEENFWNEAELEWIKYFYVPDRYTSEEQVTSRRNGAMVSRYG